VKKLVSLVTCAFALTACNRNPPPIEQQSTPKVVPAEGQGEATEPRVGPNPGVPVETAPPNVPDNKPAFAGQTRANAVHTKTGIKVDEVAKDLDHPWALSFLPDRRMLVTEKYEGKLVLLGADGKKLAAVAGVPKVDGRDQCGLLGLTLAPDYAQSQLLFLSYCEKREGGNGLAVARARFVDGTTPKLDQLKVIFRMQPTLDSAMHSGGRMLFAPDGMLIVALGERSKKEGRVQAQDLKSHFGKIVRIHPDGSVPKDNPFVSKPEARPEIWSYGHRNVLGIALDGRHRLWVAEMGPRGGDELNEIHPGKDYGWPTIGYGEEYSGEPIHKTTQAPGMEQPVYYWDPVISPGALMIYSGRLFREWTGNFFIAGLSSKALVRLVVEKRRVVGEERLLTSRDARIRDVVEGPDGAIYVLTDGSGAKVWKLTPA
jgi:glucose/arabinose dehydrogenase